MRTFFNADRSWKFSVDDETTEKTVGVSHSEIYGANSAGRAPGAAGFSCNDDDWRTVDLPHDRRVEVGFDENTAAVHGSKIRENVWYRKTFDMPAEYKGKHFTLVFEGISVYANIYFNGSLAGRSTSAYSETALDITPRMRFGKTSNTISVEVDGKRCEGWWYEGTGIYRHVRLYAKEMLHIAHNGLWINPVKGDDGKWTVFAEIEAENSAYTESGDFTVEVELFDKNGVSVARAQRLSSLGGDEKSAVMLEIDVEDPDLWDIDDPCLYKAVARIYRGGELLDEDSTPFGFRTFYFDRDKGFFLNGRSAFINGVCCHQDHAGVGVAVPDSIQDMRIKILKDAGVNAYRCAHNMHAKEILDACDRYGLLVMDENRKFEANEETLVNVHTMVKRDRNHPSIIMWSLYNEEGIQGTEESGAIFAKMKSVIRKLDTTRPITGASNKNYYTGVGSTYEMDVIGVNYNYPSLDRIHASYPNTPMIGSENTSAVAVRGQQTRDMDNNIIEDFDTYGCFWGCTMQEQFKVNSTRPWLTGFFAWTGFDYRGEPTPFKYPTVSSLFGLFDLCGYPKASAYVASAGFRPDVPMMKLLHHWNHKVGETVRIMTVTNADEVELFVNGKSLGRRPSKLWEQCYWDVEFVPGELYAVGYKDGKAVCEDTLKTPEKAAKIVAAARKTILDNSGKDAAAIDVLVTDEAGNPVQNAEGLIKFEALGDCEIIGVGNGDPNSHESDKASERLLFAGRCQAIVQVKDRAKSASVKVACEGYESATVELEIKEVEQDIYLPESSGGRKIGEVILSNDTFKEKPDPNMVLADTDMNNFVVWSMGIRTYQDFDDGWKLYRYKAKTPNIKGQNKRAYLFVESFIYIEYELWVNGRLAERHEVDHKGSGNPSPCRKTMRFDTCGDSELELTLIIRANAGNAGIRGGEFEFSLGFED